MNNHIEHFEDMILQGDFTTPFEVLCNLNLYNYTTKWDGSPAILIGQDPRDRRFFIAKKSFFNKTRVFYKSEDDIRRDIINPDLANVLVQCFNKFKDCGITNIIQGDVLFLRNELKEMEIHGKSYTTFHPNAIVYASPEELDYDVGIVFHTRYDTEDMIKLKTSYVVDISSLDLSKDVYAFTANVNDRPIVSVDMNTYRDINDRLDGTFAEEFSQMQSLHIFIKAAYNKLVRTDEEIVNPRVLYSRAIQYIEDKMLIELNKRKTENGKNAVYTKYQEFIVFLTSNKEQFYVVYELFMFLATFKIKLMEAIKSDDLMDTFVKTKKGFLKTAHEGFVMHRDGSKKPLKLVDRYRFSHHNFSSEYIKGWDRSSYK